MLLWVFLRQEKLREFKVLQSESDENSKAMYEAMIGVRKSNVECSNGSRRNAMQKYA